MASARSPVRQGRRSTSKEGRDHEPAADLNLLSAISLGLALMFGTAGLPHILMRFFTVKDAQAARKSVLYATGFIGYFYILTFIIGFGAIVLVSTDAAFLDARSGEDEKRDRGDQGRLQHGSDPSRRRCRRQHVPRLHIGVAFATILAVVSGLALAGESSIAMTFTPW